MLPSSSINGFMKISSGIITAILKIADRAKPVDPVAFAPSVSPWPNLPEIMLPDPWPHMKPIAWNTACTDIRMPIAAAALVPIFPTKKASARL